MQNGTDIVNVNVINRSNETFITTYTNNSQQQQQQQLQFRFDTGQINQLNLPDDDITTIENKGVLPDIYIWGFLTFIVIIGTILNCLAIYALIRAKYNGTRYFLLQISFCDLGTLLISILELHYTNNRKWLFPEELCPIYLGLESFINTATIYFIIAINFHAISTHNLVLESIQRQKNDKLDENEYTELTSAEATSETTPDQIILTSSTTTATTSTFTTTTDEDNYEIAITDHEQLQKRSLTIDYSRKKNSISVILPALFIWFLAASISIPFFVFSNVIPSEMNPSICGIINFDKQSNHLMQIFIILIRIIISSICLCSTFIYIIKIFFMKSSSTIKSKILIECYEIDENINVILKLALYLSITFIVFTLHRLYGSLLFEVFSTPFMHYKYPQMNRTIGLIFSLFSFLLPPFRPLMYFSIDKRLRSALRIGSRKKRRSMMSDNGCRRS